MQPRSAFVVCLLLFIVSIIVYCHQYSRCLSCFAMLLFLFNRRDLVIVDFILFLSFFCVSYCHLLFVCYTHSSHTTPFLQKKMKFLLLPVLLSIIYKFVGLWFTSSSYFVAVVNKESKRNENRKKARYFLRMNGLCDLEKTSEGVGVGSGGRLRGFFLWKL